MAEMDLTDELDYHITFPTPLSQELSDDDFEDLGYTEQKEPVVILLGWAGCQEKHLAKYTAIYDQRRCITIQYTAPADQVFYKPESLGPVAVKILELILDLSLEENPIFFHVFSNGGGYVYRFITEVMTTDPQFSELQIRGCIMDSVPSKRRILVAARALISTMKVNQYLAYTLAFFWILYMLAQKLLNHFLQPFGITRTTTMSAYENYIEVMKTNRCPWPQLFLYSKADQIVPYQDIEEVMDARKTQGITVHSKCWEDSEHVAHLRMHHDEYIQHCYNFLDHCMKVD